MGLDGIAEEEVRDAYDVVYDLRAAADIDESVEDLGGGAGDTREHEEREEPRLSEAVDGYSGLADVAEEAGRFPREGHRLRNEQKARTGRTRDLSAAVANRQTSNFIWGKKLRRICQGYGGGCALRLPSLAIFRHEFGDCARAGRWACNSEQA